jgi:hypothetical protein
MTDDRIDESIAKDPAAYDKAQKTAADYERKVVSDVLDAWIRQREHGFDMEHDLSHNDGELSFAAATYAIQQVPHPTPALLERPSPTWYELWPWEHSFYKPKTRRENLLRATAFLLSELTRLDAENSPFGSEENPMSDKPSPYDAGPGPLANSPRKVDSWRHHRSLHGAPPCTGLTEIIFWHRIGEGPQPPYETAVLLLAGDGVFRAMRDSRGTWFHCPLGYRGEIVNPLAWASWPEGPTTCD